MLVRRRPWQPITMQVASAPDAGTSAIPPKGIRSIFRALSGVAKRRGVGLDEAIRTFAYEVSLDRYRSSQGKPLDAPKSRAWLMPRDFDLVDKAVRKLRRIVSLSDTELKAELIEICLKRPRRGGSRKNAGRRPIDWHHVMSSKSVSLPTVQGMDPETHENLLCSQKLIVQDAEHLAMRCVAERAVAATRLSEMAICRKLVDGASGPAGQSPEQLAHALQDRLKEIRNARARGDISPRQVARMQAARRRFDERVAAAKASRENSKVLFL